MLFFSGVVTAQTVPAFLEKESKVEEVTLYLTDILEYKDGYIFEHKDYVKKNLIIRLVLYPDYESLQRFTNIENAAAVSYVAGDYCIIHTVDPSIIYAPQYMGHEISHCIFGNWHPSIK